MPTWFRPANATTGTLFAPSNTQAATGGWLSSPGAQDLANGTPGTIDLDAFLAVGETITLVSPPAAFTVAAGGRGIDYDGTDQPNSPSARNDLTARTVVAPADEAIAVTLNFATAAVYDTHLIMPGNVPRWAYVAGPAVGPYIINGTASLLFGESVNEFDTYRVTGVPSGLSLILGPGGSHTGVDSGIGPGTHAFTVEWVDHSTGAIATRAEQFIVTGDTQAPSHSAGPTVLNITETALDVQGTLDESGDVRVLVVISGAGQPLEATFDAVTPVAATQGVQYTFNVTGIATGPGSSVDVWIEARDAAGNRGYSSVAETMFDNPPTVINPNADINLVNGTPFTFTPPASTFSEPVTMISRLVGGAALSTVGLAFDGTSYSGTLADDATANIELVGLDASSQQASDIFVLSMAAAPNQIPTVANPIADINVQAGVSWLFQFASDVFDDPDLDVLTYTSQLQGGAALPTVGISFTPSTRTYLANNPAVQSATIELDADDGRGGVAQDVFIVDFVLQSPNLTGSLPTLNLIEGQPMTPIDLSLIFNGLPDTYASIGAALPTGVNLIGSIISGTPTGVATYAGLQFQGGNAAGNTPTNTVTWEVIDAAGVGGTGGIISSIIAA